MHEFSIIESLVERITQSCVESSVDKVALIRLRRGGTFSEEALHQAFMTFTVGTPLEGTRIEVESNDHLFECDQCGYQQRITHDDLVGHVFVCPGCGAMKTVDEAHDLELLEVVLDRPKEEVAASKP